MGSNTTPVKQEAGSTSPLWSMLTAPVHWLNFLGTDAVTLAVKLIGLALALFSIHAVKRISHSISKSEPTGIFAASMLALDPRLAFSALSGMETSLLLALWLGATSYLLRRKFLMAAILISLAPTVRPEALVILPFFALAFLLSAPRKWWTLLILPIPMVLWSLFCLFANGRLLPTTFYMKSTPIQIGIEQFYDAWKLLGYNGPLPSLLVAVLLILATAYLLRNNRSIPIILLLIGAPLAFLFGVLFSREFETDGFYWLRWTDPTVIILTTISALALGLFFIRSNGWKAKAITSFILLTALPHFVHSNISWRNRLISDSRSINLITIQAGKWINQNTASDTVVAVNDAGATRYFGKRKTIDLIGLNCADIAFGRMNPENRGIVDYLAITPTWFYGKGLYDDLTAITNFSIPPEEYTITSNKGQSEIVIFRCR